LDLHVSLVTAIFYRVCSHVDSLVTAAGKYGIFVPFYNGVFSGKAARVQLHGSESLDEDLQSLDLSVDRHRPGIYKGYRGAFVSIWPGASF
jgi:hypothetical protein